MITLSQIIGQLNKVTRLLPNSTSNPILQRSISDLRQQEIALASSPSRRSHSAVRGTTAYAHALLGAGALLLLLVQIILAVLIAVAVIKILWDLSRPLADAVQSLLILIQQAITSVTQARTRIREIARTHPRAAPCMPHFDTIIDLLNQMARRLNSPASRAPTRQFFDRLLQLAQSLVNALDALIQCLDPTDELGLKNEFFGPNGHIRRALRRIRSLISR